MGFPPEFKYTKEHEWLSSETDGSNKIGITDYALEQLGDVVHIELPEKGESFEVGATFGTIESTKTVSDLYMPVSGKVSEINDKLVDELEKLAEAPYADGWLIKIQPEGNDGELMSAEEYESFIAEEE